MPGVLTHLSVALIGLSSIYLFTDSWKHGFAFAFGHIIPDAIKFGIPGIELKTFSFDRIILNPLFWTLNHYTHSFYYWSILLFGFLVILFLFYRLNKIKFDKFKFLVFFSLFVYLGAIIHLILDLLIIEKSYWI